MKPLSKIYFDTDMWEPVPLISQELIDAGYENSEACQVCPYVVLDPISGQYGFYAIDCGGVYRTDDFGKSWKLRTIGLTACAATGMTFDPNNINRVVAIGCNSGYCRTNGIYFTNDMGESWSKRFLPGYDGFEGELGVAIDHRVQFAFDVNSYDETLGGSKIIYWSRENKTTDPAKNFPAIYKSADGGDTWQKLAGTEHIGGGDIYVNNRSEIIASNRNGAWVSKDGGATWRQVSDLKIYVMNMVPTRPDNVYAATKDAFYTSTDFGETFNKTDVVGFPDDIREFRSLRVAPSNPDYMIIFRIGDKVDWDYTTHYSKDGGKTWHLTAENKEGIWIPMNEHMGTYWYSPVDENYIISNEYRSEDGGENLFVSTKGFNGSATTGVFVNVNNDRLIAVSNQDFNGGFSTDGGKTWTYVNWSGERWGGFTYGAYALTDKIVCAAKSLKWHGTGEIVYTTDGGKTVIGTGVEVNGLRVGYGVCGKENIAFIAENRTDDYCKTWTKMDGCLGVLTHDSKSGRLFGVENTWAVYSDDDGISWTKLCRLNCKILGMAYNSRDDILYITTSERRLYHYNFRDETPTPTLNENILAGDVCVDPENPSIIYISYETWMYYDTPSVCRSLDGGETWTNLCRTVGDGRDDCLDGGRNSWSISFIPSSREIITSTNCRGIWKMKACDSSNGK